MSSIPAVPAKYAKSDPQLWEFLSALRNEATKTQKAAAQTKQTVQVISALPATVTDDAVVEKDLSDKAGTRSKTITAYKWDTSTPGSHDQVFSYDWDTNTVSAYPSGWGSVSGPSPGAYYTLYGLILYISATGDNRYTSADWGDASVQLLGYATGENKIIVAEGTISLTGAGTLTTEIDFGSHYGMYMAEVVGWYDNGLGTGHESNYRIVTNAVIYNSGSLMGNTVIAGDSSDAANFPSTLISFIMSPTLSHIVLELGSRIGQPATATTAYKYTITRYKSY